MSVSAEVLRLLQKKYNQEFAIDSSYYEKGIGQHILLAHPLKQEAVKFQVNYDPESSFLKSYYPIQLWEYQATQYLNDFLEKYYNQFVCKMEVKYKGTYSDEELPSFTQLTMTHPDQLKVTCRIYLFSKIEPSNFEEALEGVLALIKDNQQKKIANTVYTLHFFNPTSFQKKDLNQFKFGFNHVEPGDFEESEMEHFQCQMRFKLSVDSDIPSADAIFKIRKEEPFAMGFEFF